MSSAQEKAGAIARSFEQARGEDSKIQSCCRSLQSRQAARWVGCGPRWRAPGERRKGVHENTWRQDVVIKHAFDKIGVIGSHHLRQSSQELQQVSVTAATAEYAYSNLVWQYQAGWVGDPCSVHSANMHVFPCVDGGSCGVHVVVSLMSRSKIGSPPSAMASSSCHISS